MDQNVIRLPKLSYMSYKLFENPSNWNDEDKVPFSELCSHLNDASHIKTMPIELLKHLNHSEIEAVHL